MADRSLLHRFWPVDAAQVLLVVSTLLAVAVPMVVWGDLAPPGRGLMVVGFVLLVPGTAVAIWVTDDRRSLWLGLAPAISLVAWMIVALAQALTNTMSPALTTSIVAFGHVVALPGAWLATGRRTRPAAPSAGALRRVSASGVLLVALVLWRQATRSVDLDATGALGLIDVAPPTYWLALALTCAVAGWAVTRREPDRVVLGASLVTFIVVAYAFVSVADGTPVAPTTFVHLGLSDAIHTLGFIPQGIEARFSWSAFFTGAGATFDAAGNPNGVGALVWYPVVANVLVLAPLIALGRALTGSERVGWAGAFAFLTLNWVQQDYFSPQSVAFLVLLVMIATLAVLHRESEIPPVTGRGVFRLLRLPARTPGRPAGWSATRLLAMEATLVFLGVGLAVGHQLTPGAAIAITGLLSLTGVIRQRTLWLALAAVGAAWFAFGATDWWTDHLAWLLNGVGAVGEAVSSGGLKRVAGDPWYARLQLARVAWSAAFAGAAAIGWWQLRRRPSATFAAACVAGPVLLIGAQPYGGEILLRVLLYTSPVIAVLAAQALLHLTDKLPRLAPFLVIVAFVGAGVAFTVARGVNTAFERTPADVLAAAEIVLDEAPPRATISPLRAEASLQMRRFREVDSPQTGACLRTPLECILRQNPDYVFLTTTRDRYDELRNGAISSYSLRLADQLLTSGRYRIRVQGPNVVVLQRTDLVPRPPEVPS